GIELAGSMWGISRSVFDLILLETAREAGVKVWQPARMEERGRVRDLVTNVVETIRSDLVVMADGKGFKSQASGDFGIKAHFELRDVPRDAVQLFGARG